MKRFVGIELNPGFARAAAGADYETTWDPAQPAELIRELRSQFGAVRGIVLSVGLGFLYVKQVKLPPAPAAARRRIVQLEPDRFFPVRDETLAVSLCGHNNLAFALDAELCEKWINAFEEWAPVVAVEAAPLSLARIAGNGTYSVVAGPDEKGVVEVSEGQVHSVRRIPRLNGAADVPPFMVARGAARGAYGRPEEMLVTPHAGARIARRRVQRLSISALAFVASLVCALWSFDHARVRKLHRIESEITRLQPVARRAVELRRTLAGVDRESSTIGDLSRRRIDPLLILAALSRHLPPGAVVLNLKADAREWQIDGTARDAAALIPLLDRDPRFEDVRFLSASSRFREANRTYETFSIAFHVRPQS